MSSIVCPWGTVLMLVLLEMQGEGTWEGYLVAAAASQKVLGPSTVAQDLLRKRYMGISGSNRVVGALDIQQVSSWQSCW